MAVRRAGTEIVTFLETYHVINKTPDIFSVHGVRYQVTGVARAAVFQKAIRAPPLMTRPSSGAHASTVHRPSAA